MNSSPPKRATTAGGSTAAPRRSATARSSSSPKACPRVSFTSLKRSRSMNSTPTAPRADGPAELLVEQRPVGRAVSGSWVAWWRRACSRSWWSRATAASRAAARSTRLSVSPGVPVRDEYTSSDPSSPPWTTDRTGSDHTASMPWASSRSWNGAQASSRCDLGHDAGDVAGQDRAPGDAVTVDGHVADGVDERLGRHAAHAPDATPTPLVVGDADRRDHPGRVVLDQGGDAPEHDLERGAGAEAVQHPHLVGEDRQLLALLAAAADDEAVEQHRRVGEPVLGLHDERLDAPPEVEVDRDRHGATVARQRAGERLGGDASARSAPRRSTTEVPTRARPPVSSSISGLAKRTTRSASTASRATGPPSGSRRRSTQRARRIASASAAIRPAMCSTSVPPTASTSATTRPSISTGLRTTASVRSTSSWSRPGPAASRRAGPSTSQMRVQAPVMRSARPTTASSAGSWTASRTPRACSQPATAALLPVLGFHLRHPLPLPTADSAREHTARVPCRQGRCGSRHRRERRRRYAETTGMRVR